MLKVTSLVPSTSTMSPSRWISALRVARTLALLFLSRSSSTTQSAMLDEPADGEHPVRRGLVAATPLMHIAQCRVGLQERDQSVGAERAVHHVVAGVERSLEHGRARTCTEGTAPLGRSRPASRVALAGSSQSRRRVLDEAAVPALAELGEAGVDGRGRSWRRSAHPSYMWPTMRWFWSHSALPLHTGSTRPLSQKLFQHFTVSGEPTYGSTVYEVDALLSKVIFFTS